MDQMHILTALKIYLIQLFNFAMSKKQTKTRKKKPVCKLAKEINFDNEQQQGKIQTPQMRVFQANRILCGKMLPNKFKFREKEVTQIQQSIKGLLASKKSHVCKIIMITGSPGAGKTMSTNHVLQKLEKEDYKIISLNSNLLKKRHDIQTILAEELLGADYDWEDQKNLTTFKIITQLERQKSKIKKCILYVEQVELFFNSHKQALTENFFDIFLNKNLKIVLLGISNTIDALQRYGDKLKVKTSQVLNIVFNPYTIQQLKQIILDKFREVYKVTGIQIIMDQKLARFVANKINQLKKGDMRMVFQFLKSLSHNIFSNANNPLSQTPSQSSSLYKQQPQQRYQITIQQVNRSLNNSSSKSQLISDLPFQALVILIAIYSYLKQYDQISVTDQQLVKKLAQVYHGIGVECRKDIAQDIEYLVVYGMVQVRAKGDKGIKKVQDFNSKGNSNNSITNNNKRYLLKISMNDIKNCLQDHPVFGKFV